MNWEGGGVFADKRHTVRWSGRRIDAVPRTVRQIVNGRSADEVRPPEVRPPEVRGRSRTMYGLDRHRVGLAGC